ncbi:MAG: SDR family oxidoreductase [Anaerolineae bacterium]|nr:SDR family oxidoreductase [Anaerolineae bacterium]
MLTKNTVTAMIERQNKRPPGQSRHSALITGASQGLGRALARECASRNMDLLLVALPASGLPEVAGDLGQRHDVQVEYLEMDLTASDSSERVCRWISDKKCPVSILINNAGVGYNARFEDSTLQENESCILLNNLALVKLTRLMLPEMKHQQKAFILNVASMAAFFPMPFMPVYAPSKAFILNFSLALREEMRGTPIKTSVLCPNGIRTNPDCQARIEASGLAARLTCMDPEPVAACAIEGMLAGKAVIVPGLLNKLIVAAGQVVPRSAIYAVVSTIWGRTAKRRHSTQDQPARPGSTTLSYQRRNT